MKLRAYGPPLVTAIVLSGCASIQTVMDPIAFQAPESRAGNVQELVTRENRDDPRKYWLDAVKSIEGAAATNEAVPLSCIRSPLEVTYRTTAKPNPQVLLEKGDEPFYHLLAESHNALINHLAPLQGVMKVADGEFAHKDDFKELALRGVVAYERLLDHHRFLLNQLKKADCLSEQASNFDSPDTQSRYLRLVKDVKVTTEVLSDLTAMANASFAKYVEPLQQRKSYLPRVDTFTFLHGIYAEDPAAADRDCGTVVHAPHTDSWRLYACGYFYEKFERFDDANNAYERLKSITASDLEYVGRAKKREAYIKDYQIRLIEPETIASAAVKNNLPPHQIAYDAIKAN